MSNTLIIYKEPYVVRFFLIPDSKISKEQRELFEFADKIDDADYIGFRDPEEIPTQSEYDQMDASKKRKMRSCTIITEKQARKRSKTAEEAESLADRYEAASELLYPEKKDEEEREKGVFEDFRSEEAKHQELFYFTAVFLAICNLKKKKLFLYGTVTGANPANFFLIIGCAHTLGASSALSFLV
jgi:hypothetical protein